MPKTCDDGNIANFVCGTFLWKKFKHMAKARIIKFTHIHIHVHICMCVRVCHRITVREPPPFAFIEWKASIHANFTRAAQCRMRAHCSSSCCCCCCLYLCLCCCSASLLLSFFRCPELSALCTLLKTRNCGRPANSCSVYFWRQCQAGRQGGEGGKLRQPGRSWRLSVNNS